MVRHCLVAALIGLAADSHIVEASRQRGSGNSSGVTLMKAPKIEKAIVNGCDVDDNEARFYAQLKMCPYGTNDWTCGDNCGASWVSPTRLLTAAHCVHNIPLVLVYTNDDNYFSRYAGANYEITDIVIHSGFDADACDRGVDCGNDIAMLKLPAGATPYEHYIQMADMSDFDDRMHDDPMIAYGTGRKATDKALSRTLLETHPLGFLPCQQMSNYDLWKDGELKKSNLDLPVHGPSKSVVCINSTESTNTGYQGTTCGGDSGGPLVHHGKLYGLVSYGFPPCENFMPKVFSSVSYFKDRSSFISQNMETGIPTDNFSEVPQEEHGKGCTTVYGNKDGTVQESCSGRATFAQNFVHVDRTIRPFGESSVATKMCILRHDSKVKVAACDSQRAVLKSKTFQWHYSTQTKQISSRDRKLCWTAATNRAEVRVLAVKACNANNGLQKFSQINGRIHLSVNEQVCVSFTPGSFEREYAKNPNYKLSVKTRPCNPQLFGTDVVSASGCNPYSTVDLAWARNSKQQIRAFKERENQQGLCLYKSGGFAKVGKCQSTTSYKMEWKSQDGLVMVGNDCLTAPSTSTPGMATFEKCSSTLSIKQRQQWVWTDGRFALQKQPRIVLQYNYRDIAQGTAVVAKTGWAMSFVFGNIF